MNFIKKKYQIALIFLGMMLFLGLPESICRPIKSNNSGTPIIQKFVFPNYSTSSGKFSVYEDSSGIFLIGAKDKIIVFYGNEFITYKLNGRINITSNLKSLFYTGYNSLGMIKLYRNAPPQIIPIFENNQNKLNFGQIQDMFVAEQNIIISNGKKIIVFDGSNFSVIDSSKINVQLYKIDNTILVYKSEQGILKYTEDKLVPILYAEKFINKTIQKILPFQGGLLIKCAENKGFIYLKNNEYSEPNFGFEDFIDQTGFTDACDLGNGSLAIGTKGSGLLIYNAINNTINNIRVDEGLLDNTINTIHLDRNGNLWALHDIGISRIENNIPISLYGHFAGINGNVNDISKQDDNLYLATSNGLLRTNYKEIPGAKNFTKLYFSSVSGINSECLKLLSLNNKMYAVTRQGIYIINESAAQLIYSDNFNAFRKSPLQVNSFYYGNENGINLLLFNNGSFNLIGTNDLNNNHVTDIAIEQDGLLWLKTTGGSLIKLKFDSANLHSSIKIYDKKGIFSFQVSDINLLQTQSGVRFLLPGQIYYFNKKNNSFYVDTTLRPGNLKGISWLYPIAVDNDGNKWCHFSGDVDNISGILMIPANEGSPLFFNTNRQISPVYTDDDLVWIGGFSQLLQFNCNKKYNTQKSFFTIIKRIIVGADSVLKVGLVEPEISHKYNDIQFEVSSSNFEAEPNIRYQYMLEGYSKKWTGWRYDSQVKFRNLKPGRYTFKVRALSVNGMTSETTEFEFYIQFPIYLTWPAYIVYFVLLFLLTLVYFKWRMWNFVKDKEKLEQIVHSRTEEILKEKDKSEQLIANLFPKGTADELKLTGKATSQKFAMVTVLFSDIQGFTKIAEQMNPETLIDELDAFFFHFDMVVEKYNIEKIKTIGDAYMCAGGIPNKNITNPVEVVLAALEVQEYMRELKTKNADIWDLRIGIHTGSVIAGVVGHKKLSYDIWGDTVNTASRMESSGEPGKVNISGQTYELVKDFFICEYRGRMPVKYKGEIDMYFVKCIRPELSVNMKNIPNKKFLLQLQSLRIQDLDEDIFNKIEKEFPISLYFHNKQNIKDIYNMVELLGRAEELSDEENLLLRTAALLHDIGYIWSYDEHEDHSIDYAREILPDYQYTEEQIQKICSLIEVTKNMRRPESRIEEIMLDAEMHYLGRADYVTLSDNLFFELYEKGKIQTKNEWVRMQNVLLSNHKYFTKTASLLSDVSHKQQIQNMREHVKKSSDSEQ
jgi:adenylate cyclase